MWVLGYCAASFKSYYIYTNKKIKKEEEDATEV